MDIKGFYINLDRSTERRAALEAQLNSIGALGRFERVQAVDGNSLNVPATDLKEGEVGCLVSHCQALERAAMRPHWTLIVEDDVVISPITFPTLDDLVRRGIAEKYDLLFTDMVIPIGLLYMRHFKQLFDAGVVRNAAGAIERIRNFAVIDLKGSSFAGMTSYLVNGHSASKLADLLRREIATGPKLPVDLLVQEKIAEGSLRAAVVFPFITSVNLGTTLDSTIAARGHDNVANLATSVFRNSLFVGGDLRLCEQLLERAMPAGKSDPLQHLLVAVCAYVLAGEVEP